jgi:ABC transporter substrate binding protein
MGLPRSNDGEGRFAAYVEGLTSVIGHADRAKPLRDYCLGFDAALRAQKRGADGSDDSARTDRSPASVAAAFYRQGKKHRMPTMFIFRTYVEAGGLLSYGADFVAMHRQAATHVAKIFKGAKVGDIPIEQSRRCFMQWWRLGACLSSDAA